MMNRHPGRRLSIVLLVLCGGLSAVIANRLTTPLPAPDWTPDPAPAMAIEAPAIAVTELPALMTLDETRARPLFQVTRRPPVTLAPEQVAQPTNEGLNLIGVTVFDQGRIALVQRQSDGRVLRVTEGQRVEGWIAVEIDSGRLVLRQDGTSRELHLRDRPAGALPAAGLAAQIGTDDAPTEQVTN